MSHRFHVLVELGRGRLCILQVSFSRLAKTVSPSNRPIALLPLFSLATSCSMCRDISAELRLTSFTFRRVSSNTIGSVVSLASVFTSPSPIVQLVHHRCQFRRCARGLQRRRLESIHRQPDLLGQRAVLHQLADQPLAIGYFLRQRFEIIRQRTRILTDVAGNVDKILRIGWREGPDRVSIL